MKYLIYIVIFLLCIFAIFDLYNYEHMISIPYEQNNRYHQNYCTYNIGNTINEALRNNKINYDLLKNRFLMFGQWNFFLPCGYNMISNEIELMPVRKGAKYFIIENCDQITSKNKIWINLVEKYGLEKAKNIMPNTYVLSNNKDMERLKQEHTDGMLYIMKKNIQRQQGLEITNNMATILNNKNSYSVVQELLQDPYTISGHKINLRIYILVVSLRKNIDVYLYNDGFMYYTPKKFVKGTTGFDTNVTTGYVDRRIYEENPLTHKDFQVYLDSDRNLNSKERDLRGRGIRLSNYVFKQIDNLFKNVFLAFEGKIGGGKLENNICFQLFGADIGINENLQPILIEINKGPDLGAKDKRDSEVKIGMATSAFSILKGETVQSGFKLILEI